MLPPSSGAEQLLPVLRVWPAAVGATDRARGVAGPDDRGRHARRARDLVPVGERADPDGGPDRREADGGPRPARAGPAVPGRAGSAARRRGPPRPRSRGRDGGRRTPRGAGRRRRAESGRDRRRWSVRSCGPTTDPIPRNDAGSRPMTPRTLLPCLGRRQAGRSGWIPARDAQPRGTREPIGRHRVRRYRTSPFSKGSRRSGVVPACTSARPARGASTTWSGRCSTTASTRRSRAGATRSRSPCTATDRSPSSTTARGIPVGIVEGTGLPGGRGRDDEAARRRQVRRRRLQGLRRPPRRRHLRGERPLRAAAGARHARRRRVRAAVLPRPAAARAAARRRPGGPERHHGQLPARPRGVRGGPVRLRHARAPDPRDGVPHRRPRDHAGRRPRRAAAPRPGSTTAASPSTCATSTPPRSRRTRR